MDLNFKKDYSSENTRREQQQELERWAWTQGSQRRNGQVMPTLPYEGWHLTAAADTLHCTRYLPALDAIIGLCH